MPSLSGWPLGVDNVHDDHELPRDALRNAVNVDILDSGKIRQRNGHVLSLAATSAHSLWSDENNAYYVEGNQLKKFNTDNTSTVIGTVNTDDNHLAYKKINEQVYFSSKIAKGKLVDGQLKQWGIDVPTSPPGLSLYSGTLEAGTYFAVVTYVADDGRESGASVQTSITLTDVGGIAVIGMPVPADATIAKKRLYLSTPNGEVLYMAKEVSADAQFIDISTLDLRQECRTLHLSPPPFSTAIAYANGRLFMVDAEDSRIVWFTESISYELVDRRKNYYVFDKPVTLIAGTATGRGLYICAGETYFISNAGVKDQDGKTTIFGFGAFAESLSTIPTTKEPIWMTERGAVIGKEDGGAQLLAAGRLEPGKMINVASMVREQNSIRQFVAVGNKTDASTVEAGSYAEAEIIRRS